MVSSADWGWKVWNLISFIHFNLRYQASELVPAYLWPTKHCGTSSPTLHAVNAPAASLLVLLAIKVDVDGLLLLIVQLEEILHLPESFYRHVFGHFVRSLVVIRGVHQFSACRLELKCFQRRFESILGKASYLNLSRLLSAIEHWSLSGNQTIITCFAANSSNCNIFTIRTFSLSTNHTTAESSVLLNAL